MIRILFIVVLNLCMGGPAGYIGSSAFRTDSRVYGYGCVDYLTVVSGSFFAGVICSKSNIVGASTFSNAFDCFLRSAFISDNCSFDTRIIAAPSETKLPPLISIPKAFVLSFFPAINACF